MPQQYRKAARARTEAATAQRILDAARATLLESRRFGVRDIAKAAGVSVQTVYSHYGSKGGLVMAVIDAVSRDHGLWAKLDDVRREPRPRAALDRMIATTFEFWHEAWPFIDTSLELRRSDADYAGEIRKVDDSRLADLVRICEQLAKDGELRAGLSPRSAAALVFAISCPQVYEELVAAGRFSYAEAARRVRQLALEAVTGR